MNITAADSKVTLLSRIAERTLRFDMSVWFWGDAIACDGLIEAGKLTGDERFVAPLKHLFRRATRQPLSWVDYLTPGCAMIAIEAASEKPEKSSGALRLAQWLSEGFPKTAEGLHLFRPDLPAYRNSVWVDSMYHVPSFFALLGATRHEPHWFVEAERFIASHCEALKSAQGPLLAHSLDIATERQKGYGWGRGQGWALLGLIDTIEHLPAGSPARASITKRFLDLADAVRPLQDRSGFWRTLMHEREAYLETSTAAFCGAAYTKGVRLGLLDPSYSQAADAAWQAMVSRVDARGGVGGVSAVTWSWVPGMDEVAMYKSLPTEINLWGQGAALRFAAERCRAALPH